MEIAHELNQPYTGIIEGHHLVRSVPLKLYFASILGRSNPENYEWDSAHNLLPEDLVVGLENALISTEHKGVPHIAISFPHVTAVYRWGDPRRSDERETNIHRVGLGKTSELDKIVLVEPKAPFEIGCPAEIYVVGEEMAIRAGSQTMNQYLNTFIGNRVVTPIANTNMFREALEK